MFKDVLDVMVMVQFVVHQVIVIYNKLVLDVIVKVYYILN